MEDREYESITQMQGSMSQQNVAEPTAFERANYVAEPTAFERANYMKVLLSWRQDPTGRAL